ncbi:MAG: Dam family site-specific DNA-(adenine-N6)-methyltransferase [Caldilineaceae bacterium]|nr:Dam family site-specific DNA-(adenine-N6)-methyltransferase [Caldilineaceae bacterium]
MKPFLKWAGGKLRIVDRIKAVLPPGQRLLEPFVGSGALFLNTDYAAYHLADVNADLINLYQQLQQGGQAFIEACRPWFTPAHNEESTFYALRRQFNQTTDPHRKATLFVYLNKHCYNGLCRYNASGEFNVPFGRYRQPYFPAAEMMAFHGKAQQAHFAVADFVATMQAAQPGDVIYCDPPYAPLSATANFTSYSATAFGVAEQQTLAELAETLRQRGITVVLSNHDTAFTRTLYASADEQIYFGVQRHISCDGAKRHKAAEVLAVYRGLA